MTIKVRHYPTMTWIIPVNGNGQVELFIPLHPRFADCMPSEQDKALNKYLGAL